MAYENELDNTITLIKRILGAIVVAATVMLFTFVPADAAAKTATTAAKTATTAAKTATTAAQETTEVPLPVELPTPVEPLDSDLKLVHGVTKLLGPRWIQSFTKDDQYYYFIQMTNPYKGHLRLTRVKYNADGSYTSDKMDLKYFGHGSNLDCSKVNGVTYLWTGGNAKSKSDISRCITGFPFVPNTTLIKQGNISYKIPMKLNGNKRASNVYPAISADNKTLAIRYTYAGKQYYQIYKLIGGRKINPARPKKSVRIANTKGDFQGFDITKDRIYTIEGGPRKSFLLLFDKNRKYQSTVLRGFTYSGSKRLVKKIKGAKDLSFREPEGIEVSAKRAVQMMFVSNLLTDQSCNIYNVK